jgi:hypothetical protein
MRLSIARASAGKSAAWPLNLSILWIIAFLRISLFAGLVWGAANWTIRTGDEQDETKVATRFGDSDQG